MAEHRKTYLGYHPAPPTRFPPALSRLNLVCPSRAIHPEPERLVFIGWSRKDYRTVAAVFACPYRGCSWREEWGIEFRTGRPRRLWMGRYNGRRRLGAVLEALVTLLGDRIRSGIQRNRVVLETVTALLGNKRGL